LAPVARECRAVRVGEQPISPLQVDAENTRQLRAAAARKLEEYYARPTALFLKPSNPLRRCAHAAIDLAGGRW
jgi:hypothetical protein